MTAKLEQGDYVVLVQWGGGHRYIGYSGDAEGARGYIGSVVEERKRREVAKQPGARPRAFLLRVVEGPS